ncbi:hypothetical protein CH63R_14041 [Colletotrichum higginsianum IMI 349063]|uniref:Uncharacterized protein n=1 Tax=Colletotrichum higginsianum (strain IMI 349063) TaxID=759273 RepID=A0A1B7XST5_COLHI|nr:hypothetical protein CH63R_14041 [Colletotrichum higginsianum IMI 349063]OBR02815.1 hypothetical protein CH63R_14041 [Colletotrichum higginsianum IMI 349063]GJD00781.1 hypothetical protein ColKHC_09606 [Colletotrichum higginsianum]
MDTLSRRRGNIWEDEMTWSAFLRTELVRILIFVQLDHGNFAMQAGKQKKKKKKISPNKKKPKYKE